MSKPSSSTSLFLRRKGAQGHNRHFLEGHFTFRKKGGELREETGGDNDNFCVRYERILHRLCQFQLLKELKGQNQLLLGLEL